MTVLLVRMAGGRKTVNRKFILYSEVLLDDYKCKINNHHIAHLSVFPFA